MGVEVCRGLRALSRGNGILENTHVGGGRKSRALSLPFKTRNSGHENPRAPQGEEGEQTPSKFSEHHACSGPYSFVWS